tara:strand:+ start:16 stop:327 length:312 start_codon:yes stop_codon:yes gene_type:complete
MARGNSYLFFQTADNNCAAIQAAAVSTIENDDDLSVHVSFTKSGGGVGVVELTVTDGKEDDVVKEIARICATNSSPVITIADDVNSVYAVDGITAVGTITPGS